MDFSGLIDNIRITCYNKFQIFRNEAGLTGAANTGQALTKVTPRRETMANSNSTDIPENGQFNAPLSSQLDEALAWVEHYRDQLTQDRKQLASNQEALIFWLKVLEELQGQLPIQNPFKDFIQSLD